MAQMSPWIVERAGQARVWRAATRLAAMRLVDDPWLPGLVTIRHEKTQEGWERKNGVWSKLRDAAPVRRVARPAAAAANDAGRMPAVPELAAAEDDDPAPNYWWQR